MYKRERLVVLFMFFIKFEKVRFFRGVSVYYIVVDFGKDIVLSLYLLKRDVVDLFVFFISNFSNLIGYVWVFVVYMYLLFL